MLVELDVVVLEAVAFVVWLLFTVEFDVELVVEFEVVVFVFVELFVAFEPDIV